MVSETLGGTIGVQNTGLDKAAKIYPKLYLFRRPDEENCVFGIKKHSLGGFLEPTLKIWFSTIFQKRLKNPEKFWKI